MEYLYAAVGIPVAFAVQCRTSTAVHYAVEDGEMSAVLQFRKLQILQAFPNLLDVVNGTYPLVL